MLKNFNFKKLAILTLKVFGIAVFLTILFYFSLRGYFLQKAIQKAQVKLKQKYQTELIVGDAGFSGISGVRIKQMQLIPAQRDTLLILGEFSLRIKFLYALIGDIRIAEVTLNEGYLQLTKRDSIKNFDAFLVQTKDSISINETNKPEEVENEPSNYAEIAFKLISKVLNKIPAKVSINNFSLKGVDDEKWVDFKVLSLNYENGEVDSKMQVNTQLLSQNWSLSGLAKPESKQADIIFSKADTGRILIPYLPERYNLKTGFSSARFVINNISLEEDVLHIDGKASVNSFLLNHPKIASKDVVIDNMEFDYAYRIGPNYIALDSTSKVNFNGIVIRPFVYFQNGPDTIYHLVVKTEKTEAQTFVNALPDGLFSHVKGINATGSFSYRLDFIFNENKPNEMVFESTLEKDKLRIQQFGEADLTKLNREFMHHPYENGRPVRGILVGPSNPSFAPLESISVLLQKTILTTEDPSFYWHKGFVTEAFRQSIAKNIRTGKFKRGASTISMQLVKNVFLTREKTMARKLEEILLVYILENNNISSKDRMFEVYLNIIEWGPNVYGIGEAAQFYFKKNPSELTLSECMFLANIIPSPKKFMWRFGKDGMLRPYLEKSFRFVANKMINRGVLPPEDTLGLTHLIKINGSALKYIIISDTLANDSLIEDVLNQQVEGDDTDEN
jgi:hypothetical protein